MTEAWIEELLGRGVGVRVQETEKPGGSPGSGFTCWGWLGSCLREGGQRLSAVEAQAHGKYVLTK